MTQVTWYPRLNPTSRIWFAQTPQRQDLIGWERPSVSCSLLFNKCFGEAQPAKSWVCARVWYECLSFSCILPRAEEMRCWYIASVLFWAAIGKGRYFLCYCETCASCMLGEELVVITLLFTLLTHTFSCKPCSIRENRDTVDKIQINRVFKVQKCTG